MSAREHRRTHAGRKLRSIDAVSDPDGTLKCNLHLALLVAHVDTVISFTTIGRRLHSASQWSSCHGEHFLLVVKR